MTASLKSKRGLIPLIVLTGFLTLLATALPQSTVAGSPAIPPESNEQGFPVTDSLTISKCGTCHQQDAKGNLSRISWIRTSPEGWEEAIKRMVRLNGLSLTPDEARHILRYLSDSHGIAPSEAMPVENYAEHRMTDETFPSDPDVRHACAACHELARPLSWHRTPDDWKLLVNMHLAFFPSSAPIAFGQRGREAGGGEEGESTKDKRHAVDVALEYIEKSAPLHTAEWSNWSASMSDPKLAGRWLVSGDQPGKGKFYGEMTIACGSSPGEFVTKTTLHFVNDPAEVLTSKGTSIVYTGFQWRGRSTTMHGAMSPGDMNIARQVMLVSVDRSEIKGRWFWGQYQEFGMNVILHRASAGPAVLGTDVSSLKAGSSGDAVTISGDHLPLNATASSIDLGAGVKVVKVVSTSQSAIAVSVDVAEDATPGMRTITVGDIAAPNALAVYKRVDFLKVSPLESLAHLGSASHPKGYVQFVADGYSYGPDGKPGTADDIDLGSMPATWSLQEFVATYGDDDTEYVGTIDPKTGLFTPASDGPSPPRRSTRNNYGDVWAVATVKTKGSDRPLIGKSYLIVTVPQYLMYDQPEVGQ